MTQESQMAQFQNKQTKIPNGEHFATYVDLCRACIAGQGTKGFTVQEMRSRIKILDKLDTCTEPDQVVEFDPEEIGVLTESVQSMQWAILDKEIIEFADYLEGLPNG